MGLIVVVVVTAALVYALSAPWWPLSSLDRGAVARFAAAHNLALTPLSGQYVVRYLVRNLRWRRWGGFAGFAAAVVCSTVFTHTTTTFQSDGAGSSSTSTQTDHSPSWIFLVGVGYFAGTLVAEWRSGGTIAGPRRVASLHVRDARDYLDPWVRCTGYGLLAAGIAVFVTAIALPGYQPNHASSQRIALLAALFAVVLITQAAMQWVARRPQPVDDELFAAREAVRRSCVNLLGGVGAAFGWLVLAWLAGFCGGGGSAWFTSLVSVVAVLAFVMSVRSWFSLRHRAWTANFPARRAVM